ncbi:MAG: hypothetical protein J6T62_09390 [Fibrobacter sp.]|nr:hypothetical protein [Fibrobacter sp.]
MKNTFPRKFTIYTLASVLSAVFIGCGDDNSYSPSAKGLPAEVADKAELEAYECIINGEKIYVIKLEENYECDDPSKTSMEDNLDEEGYTDIEVFRMPTEIVYYGHVEDSRDGQVYKTIKFANQVWMAENLNYDYSPSGKTDSPQSWCYEDNPDNCDKYGRLYTFQAAEDTANICPQGWHLPSFAEWETFFAATGLPIRGTSSNHYQSFGGAYWLMITSEWSLFLNNLNGTNYTGFSALPAGYRDQYNYYFEMGRTANFWTGATKGISSAFAVTIREGYISVDLWFTTHACSIRCLMDDTLKFVADSSTEDSFKPKEVVKFNGNDDSEYDSNSNTLKDLRDGHVYRTATISSNSTGYHRIWMAENLNYAYLQPTTTEDSSSWCYDDDPDNCKKYGRLYLWSAAMDSAGVFSEANDCGYRKTCNHKKTTRGVCPSGWHIPSEVEIGKLRKAIGYGHMQGKLRALEGWDDCEGCTDEYGLSILPSGFRRLDKMFYSIGEENRSWLSTEDLSTYPSDDALFAKAFYMNSKGDGSSSFDKESALSVRCIKDSE